MVDKYTINHPKDQLFYKILAFVMGMNALNSQYWYWFHFPKSWLYRLQRISVFTSITLTTLSELFYIYVYHDCYSFAVLSSVYTATIITTVVLIRIVLAQTKGYKRAMEDFMEKTHLYNSYLKNKDDFIRKILIRVENMSRLSFYCYLVLCLICCSGFQLVTIIHNIQHGEEIKNKTVKLEVVIHYWLPFDYEYDVKNWAMVQVLVLYCGFSAMIVLSVYDCLNLSLIYHIIGHIQIYKRRLETFYDDSSSHGLTQDDITNKIIELSRYYTFIQRSLKSTEIAFGFNVAIIYCHNLISGALFMYQIMLPRNDIAAILSYGLLIPIYTGTMLVMSLTLEYVRISADNISDLVYNLTWECMTITNQKLVLMLLMQVQPTLEFKAAFSIKTGMQPAINIIKTAFSYYVIIRSSA